MVKNIAALLCALTLGAVAHAEPATAPIPVKVVVSMFVIGKPPGEYRFWVERQKLDHTRIQNDLRRPCLTFV